MYRKFKRKKFFKVALIAVFIGLILAGTGLFIRSKAKADLIETYKKLDRQDFQIQESSTSTGDIENMAGEIYCGTQLDKAVAYFKELRGKKLCLKLDSVKYGDIKVLKYNGKSAVLLVESEYSGSYVKVEKKNEPLRKLGVNLLCQIDLAREGRKWKISNMVVLKEKDVKI